MAITRRTDEAREVVEGTDWWNNTSRQISERTEQQSANAEPVGSVEEYRIKVEPDEEGVFIASCPDIVGCYSYGRTLDEAFKNIADAIQISTEPSNAVNSEGVLTTRLINLDASIKIAVE